MRQRCSSMQLRIHNNKWFSQISRTQSLDNLCMHRNDITDIITHIFMCYITIYVYKYNKTSHKNICIRIVLSWQHKVHLLLEWQWLKLNKSLTNVFFISWERERKRQFWEHIAREKDIFIHCHWEALFSITIQS